MKNNDIITLAFQIGNLKEIKRSGWLLKGIKNPESVADHVFRVAFLVTILSKGKKLDKDKMVKMALIHDIGESLVGDVIYEHGTKIVASLAIKNADERAVVNKIFKNLEDKNEYLPLWEEWVAQKTAEAKFVKLVEKLEMVIQALEYEKQGYDSYLFDEFWENAWKYIKGSNLEEIFKELEIKRNK